MRGAQSTSTTRVVLTGITRGLGRALLGWLDEQGCAVHGCGRSEDAIATLRAQFPRQDLTCVDVADDNAVRAWAERVTAGVGAPDLLVNNAAITAPNAPLWELDAATIDPVVRINLLGTINTIRHFLPSMIEHGSGVIVNFSSGWGRSTSPEVATYCATKWGVEGLTQALAQELPAGLAAVSLNPGIIDTDMLRTCFGTGAAHYPDPMEWVRSAGPFLLCLGARHNGQALTVPSMPTA